MIINYNGKVTAADIRKAVFLNYSPIFIWGNAVMIALAIGAIVYFSVMGTLDGTYLLALLFVILMLATPFWQPFQTAQKATRKGSLYHDPVHGTINESSVSVESGKTPVVYAWSAYTRFKQGKEIILLYKERMCVNIFTPALFASQQDWETFARMVSEKITDRKPAA
jgi:hypothetical protein